MTCSESECVSDDYCRGLCKRHYAAWHRSTNPDAYRRAVNKYQAKHGKERQRRRYQNNKAKIGAQGRMYNTGHTPELVAWLRSEQDGKCALCDVKMETGTKAHRHVECADHTEPNGVKVPRGLLCQMCNTRLGVYERIRDKLHRYESYLASPPASRYKR